MKTRVVVGVPNKDRVCALIEKRAFVILNGNHLLRGVPARSEILSTLPARIKDTFYAGLSGLSEKFLELPGVEIDSVVWELETEPAKTSHAMTMRIVWFTEELAKLEDAEALLERVKDIMLAHSDAFKQARSKFDDFKQSYEAIFRELENQKRDRK